MAGAISFFSFDGKTYRTHDGLKKTLLTRINLIEFELTFVIPATANDNAYYHRTDFASDDDFRFLCSFILRVSLTTNIQLVHSLSGITLDSRSDIFM